MVPSVLHSLTTTKTFRENEAFDLVSHTLLPVGFYLLLFTRLAVSQWVCLFLSFLIVPFYFIPHFPTLFFFMSKPLRSTAFHSLQLYTLDIFSSQRFVLGSYNFFNMFPGKILNLYLLTWIFLSWCLYLLCHLQSCRHNITFEIFQRCFSRKLSLIFNVPVVFHFWSFVFTCTHWCLSFSHLKLSCPVSLFEVTKDGSKTETII